MLLLTLRLQHFDFGAWPIFFFFLNKLYPINIFLISNKQNKINEASKEEMHTNNIINRFPEKVPRLITDSQIIFLITLS